MAPYFFGRGRKWANLLGSMAIIVQTLTAGDGLPPSRTWLPFTPPETCDLILHGAILRTPARIRGTTYSTRSSICDVLPDVIISRCRLDAAAVIIRPARDHRARHSGDIVIGVVNRIPDIKRLRRRLPLM